MTTNLFFSTNRFICNTSETDGGDQSLQNLLEELNDSIIKIQRAKSPAEILYLRNEREKLLDKKDQKTETDRRK